MVELNVKINNFSLRNPVLTASGTFGYGLEYQDLVPLNELGALLSKEQRSKSVTEMIIHVWQRWLLAC